MADDLYVAVELLKATELGITRELNEMAQKGWVFVNGWERSTPTPRTILVFQREIVLEAPRTFAEEMSLDWTVGPDSTGDSLLLDEMRAAEHGPKQPVADPLLDGGLTR